MNQYSRHFLSYAHGLCLSVGVLLLFSVNAWTQAELTRATNKKANEEVVQEIRLFNLLEAIQKNIGLTFIFDKSLIADKTVTFKESAILDFNQKIVSEISKQTGLQFKQISPATFVIKNQIRERVTVSGKVRDKLGNPLEGANLVFYYPEKGVITDENGAFSLELPRGTFSLICSYIGYEPFQQEIEVTGASDLTIPIRFNTYLKLEEILVVGNRFLPKSLQETAVPVSVVDEQRVQNSLQTDLTQLLQYEVPSFHSTHQTISDGTDHVDPISIKGLGADQVLVLVNGKRRHSSSLVNINGTVGRGSVGVDLNAIPTEAVKKVEILKDGAAAQYGSDAIAGVINVVLKNDVNKGNLALTTGITEKGDGKSLAYSAHYGLKTLEKGHTNLTFYFQSREAVNRTGAYTGLIFGDGRDEDALLVQDFFKHTGYSNNRVMSAGNSAITNTGLLLNTALPVAENVEVYLFGNVNYRLGKAAGFYRFPYQESKQSGLYPYGFSPKIHSDIFDFSLVSGIRGVKEGWNIDFSNNLGSNSFDFNIENSNNASLGLNSPTAAYSGGFAYLQNITNIDISKKQLANLPLNVAFGSEFRLEAYRQMDGEEVSWQHYGAVTESGEPKEAGFQVFPGFRPENKIKKYRHNAGIYADIEAVINPKWLIGMASRLEHYSDFGVNVSWKLSSRYRLTPSFTLRSAYNTGFRAPSLPQAYFSSHSLQFLPSGGEIIASEVAHENHESSIVSRLNIPSLKPEISNNLSLGVAAKFLKSFSLALDVYQINIKDRIVLSGQISPKEADELQYILETSNVDRIQFFTNAVNTNTKGVDITLTYEKKWEKQRFGSFIGFNTNETKASLQVSPTAILSNYINEIFNREEIARLERGQPISKFILSAQYQIHNFQVGIRTTRFGSVQYVHPMDGDPANWVYNLYTSKIESRDQLFGAKWTTDIDLSMNILSKLTCTLSLNNVFDVYPDQHTHFANTNYGVLEYSRRVQQFGIKGRLYLLKFNYII